MKINCLKSRRKLKKAPRALITSILKDYKYDINSYVDTKGFHQCREKFDKKKKKKIESQLNKSKCKSHLSKESQR